MTRIELPFETACDNAAATFSSLAAMLHFHRTGERYKPRLVVVNEVAAHRRRAASASGASGLFLRVCRN